MLLAACCGASRSTGGSSSSSSSARARANINDEVVRFYMLEGPHWDCWQQACDSVSPRESARHAGQGSNVPYEMWVEGFFLQQLRGHRWRTFTPEEAEWIIVPAYPSFSVDGVCNFSIAGLPEEHGERMALMAKEIRASALFARKGGADFFLMGVDWRLDFVTFAPFLSGARTRETLSRLAWGWLENRELSWRMRADNCEVAVPSLPAPLPAPLPLSLRQRNRTLFFMGRAYVKRMHKFNPLPPGFNETENKPPHCCEGVRQIHMPAMGFYQARVQALRRDGLAAAAPGPH
eukprot:7246216-Prymnesium_polylepis.1